MLPPGRPPPSLTYGDPHSFGDFGRASPDQAAVHFHHASVTRLNWSELRVIADVGNRTARPVDQIDKMLVGSHFLKNAVNRNLGHSCVLREP